VRDWPRLSTPQESTKTINQNFAQSEVEMGNWASMKTKRRIEDLDSLLGRGGIGATRREAILRTVLAHVKAEAPVRTRWSWSVAGLGTVAVAAAALFLLVPRLSRPALPSFRAKGSVADLPLATTPSVELDCLGASLAACPRESLLVVRVTGVRGYVSAWAEPAGGGERIWYFSAETQSPLVDGLLNPPATTTRAVKIGPEHVTGIYSVEIRVTERPMRREDLMRLPASEALAQGRALLTVTPP